jgi:3-hydroxymyristoyl/3-hydroxydecanoyl-(acyl carrier protein) dehydratase
MDIVAIQHILPHRPPFLLVDAVLELEPGVRCVGVKSVSGNEWFFATEPGAPPAMLTMPGLLIVEALAQLGGILLLKDEADPAAKVVYFASATGVVWHAPVVPGDQLRLEVTVTQRRGRLHKVRAAARVGSGVVCDGELGAVVADR